MSISLQTPVVAPTIEQQLRKLGALVTHVSFGPGHRFEPCETCGAVDANASCTVYGAEDDYRECCSWCAVTVADDFSSRLTGRFDEVTVEIGTVESPSAVLIPTPRQHDLAALLPLTCDTCAPARASVAVLEIAFDVLRKGEMEAERWHVCSACAPSCIEAVLAQHAGFVPPVMSVLPVTTREAVAA